MKVKGPGKDHMLPAMKNSYYDSANSAASLISHTSQQLSRASAVTTRHGPKNPRDVCCKSPNWGSLRDKGEHDHTDQCEKNRRMKIRFGTDEEVKNFLLEKGQYAVREYNVSVRKKVI